MTNFIEMVWFGFGLLVIMFFFAIGLIICFCAIGISELVCAYGKKLANEVIEKREAKKAGKKMADAVKRVYGGK